MNKLVTIVITSYRSRELILSHIKILNKNIKNIKIIIVENSRDKILQKIIQKKYKNVQIFLQKNIGFGSAINYGACVIEKHFMLSDKKKTLDSHFSLEPNEFKNLVESIRNSEIAKGVPIKKMTRGEILQREVLGKSIICSNDIKQNEVYELFKKNTNAFKSYVFV